MIAIDEERVKLQDLRDYKGTDDLLVAFKNAYKEVENHFKRYPAFRLKWSEKYMNIDKITKKPEPKSAAIILFRAEVNIGGTTHTVVYYTSDLKSPDGVPSYAPHHELFEGGSMIFSKNDTERLLWYLVCESHVRQGMIIPENIEQEATKLATKRGQDASLLFYIYDVASPLDDARMRAIAYQWNIDATKFATPELLKNQLYNSILSEEGRRPGQAIAEFKKQTMGLSDEMKAVSIVSQGVFKKIIEFNHAESAWFWKGDTQSPILTIPINDRGDEIQIRKRLASFLIASKKLHLLQESLGITEDEDLNETSIDVKFDKFTKWEELSWVEVKRGLKIAGVKYPRDTKMPELIALAKETYKDMEP